MDEAHNDNYRELSDSFLESPIDWGQDGTFATILGGLPIGGMDFNQRECAWEAYIYFSGASGDYPLSLGYFASKSAARYAIAKEAHRAAFAPTETPSQGTPSPP